MAKGKEYGASRDPTQWAGKTRRASRDPQYGTRKSYGGRQGPVRGQAETPTRQGRDPHPRGRQPGHQGERASVKETSRTQRLQPVHKGCKEITKSKTVLTA